MFKRKNQITLSIPEPCNENWLAMSPVEKGRFCASCQKKVIDFTYSSDREIANEFNKTQNLCGRFSISQLNRELVIPKEKSPIWMATTSAIISFLGLGTNEMYSQIKGNVKVEQTDKKILGDTIPNSIRKTEISGTVSDSSGPLPGANVVIKGTTTGVQTDLDGKFIIKVKAGDVLVFSFIGLEDKEVNATNATQMDVTLKDGNMMLGEMVIVGGITARKRSFFGRIFHSIENWFR
ncbi:MAG: carboxypeptidase-like regulatory domain-containing protein [Bacteroidota bacterium]